MRNVLTAAVLLTLVAAPAFAQCASYSLDATPISSSIRGSFAGVADFDGDGRDDLLLRDAIAYRFELRVPLPFFIPYPTGSADVVTAIADVNRDGRPDIVVAEETGLTARLYQSSGSFIAAKTAFATDSIGSIAVADFNSDGNPDVMVGSAPDLPMLLGNGSGTFTTGGNWHLKPLLGAGDFDGDGNADVVEVTPPLTGVTYHYGDGKGGVRQVWGAGASGVIRAIADFDRDGRDDVITGPQLNVVFGAPAVTWARTASFPYESNVGDGSVADLNGDGFPDLVVVGAGSFLNQKGVSFQKRSIRSGRVADADGDGIPDLFFMAGYESGLMVLHGHGDGTFEEPPAIPSTRSAAALSADLDGDDDDDVFLYGGESAVQWNDEGELQLVRIPQLTVDRIVAADVDGDGAAEIIEVSPIGELVIREIARDGSLSELARVKLGGPAGSIAAGRFKGTGDRQIAVMTGSRLRLFDWRTPDTPYVSLDFHGVAYSENYAVAATDINSDGADDLLLTGNEGTGHPQFEDWTSYVAVLYSTKSSFAPAQRVYSDNRGRLSPAVPGDFNGDGHVDFATVHWRDWPPTAIVYGDGKGGFGQEQRFMPAVEPYEVRAVDVNGDGRTDLLLDGVLALSTPEGLVIRYSWQILGRPVVVRMHRGLPMLYAQDGESAHLYKASCGRHRSAGR